MHLQTSDQGKLELGFGGYTCNWGVHMCALYETENERDEIIFGFLNAGDLAGDLQLYCPAERTKENFVEEYEKKFPLCRGHSYDDRRFNLLNAKELYYPDGKFSPHAMDKGLNAFFEESQRERKCNIRATAEMIWALEAIPGIEHLMAYESRLNYFISGKPWISICLYNITKFSGSIIVNVLRTHPYAISGGVITQNPYFQNPDDWLRKYDPEFLKTQD